jgi:hypothetical protein
MANIQLNTDPLLDTAGAAEYLQSSIPTLERHRRVGLGPDFTKMGGIVRYRKSALDRYIEESTRSAPNLRRARRNAEASTFEAV